MKRRRGWSNWLVLVILCLTACGGAPPRPESAILASSSETGEYLIGPGDTLQVFVWGQPDLSVTVPVRPDGRVSTPLIDDLVAVGKTPTQLAAEMQEILSEYLRSPEVNVIVQDFVGTPGSQIRVLGQVTEPGAVPFREQMTLIDVMMEVGGLTRFAAGNRARLIRVVDGKREEFRVRVDDLVSKGRIEENVLMRPGDIVIIPEAIF